MIAGTWSRKLLTPISHYLKDDDVTEIIFNKPGVAYLKTTKGDREKMCLI
jgi:type IV secretion system protein VirB11